MSGMGNQAKFAAQVSYDSSGGDNTYQAFSGEIPQNPAVLIFNNLSTVTVTISDDATNDALTLVAGQALVLDLRMNRIKAEDDFTFPLGTQFYAKSGGGSGSLHISILYAIGR